MVRLRGLDYEVLVHKNTGGLGQLDIINWCVKNYGPRWDIFENPQGRWTCFWAGRECPEQYRWCFADEKDAAWFMLRWA